MVVLQTTTRYTSTSSTMHVCSVAVCIWLCMLLKIMEVNVPWEKLQSCCKYNTVKLNFVMNAKPCLRHMQMLTFITCGRFAVLQEQFSASTQLVTFYYNAFFCVSLIIAALLLSINRASWRRSSCYLLLYYVLALFVMDTHCACIVACVLLSYIIAINRPRSIRGWKPPSFCLDP